MNEQRPTPPIPISTRTGDDGTTGLGNGTRLPKSSLRIQALGDLDECNCILGLLLAVGSLPEDFALCLTAIQRELFDMCAELAFPGCVRLTEASVTQIEARLDSINAGLPVLRAFVLPGGTSAAATCHLARAVARRTERSLVALSEREAVQPLALRYLNRLSDLLFVMARALNHSVGLSDVLWKPR